LQVRVKRIDSVLFEVDSPYLLILVGSEKGPYSDADFYFLSADLTRAVPEVLFLP